jgi:hypothetical protein
VHGLVSRVVLLGSEVPMSNVNQSLS